MDPVVGVGERRRRLRLSVVHAAASDQADDRADDRATADPSANALAAGCARVATATEEDAPVDGIAGVLAPWGGAGMRFPCGE